MLTFLAKLKVFLPSRLLMSENEPHVKMERVFCEAIAKVFQTNSALSLNHKLTAQQWWIFLADSHCPRST